MKTNNRHEEDNSAPAHVSDCGRVRAAVWQTVANGTARYKITVSRSFKQEDGTWKRGRTFFAGELPALVEVVAKSQQWIDRQERQANAQQPALAGI